MCIGCQGLEGGGNRTSSLFKWFYNGTDLDHLECCQYYICIEYVNYSLKSIDFIYQLEVHWISTLLQHMFGCHS